MIPSKVRVMCNQGEYSVWIISVIHSMTRMRVYICVNEYRGIRTVIVVTDLKLAE